MELFKILFDASITAAGAVLRRRNGYDTSKLDLDVFIPVAKRVHGRELDAIMDEWRKLADAFVGDEVIRRFVNAQAIELGEKIAEEYHDEMVWAS